MAGAVARAEQDLANLRKEISDLEERLAVAKEQAGKITVFLEMAQIYGANGETIPGSVVMAAPASDAAHTPASMPNSLGGLAKTAARETIAVLRERGQPVQTKELIGVLSTRGIEIPGQNPVSNLSGYLSRSSELIADRALGWSLKEWTKTNSVGVTPLLERPTALQIAANNGNATPVTRYRVPKGGVGGAAVRETLAILRERRQPIRTRELIEILNSRQIVIRGKNPVIYLSSYLCRVPDLVSDRANGWSLREWTQSSGAH
jgi:hypothetical protein